MLNFKIYAVDFDGTLCENKFPEIGTMNLELIEYLKDEQKKGAKIILWTNRENEGLLKDAVMACNDEDLYFDAVNENIPETIAEYGNDPRKISATIFIDDKSSTKFKLPFKPSKFTEEVISKIENTIGFPLYPWQKRYLTHDDFDLLTMGQQGNGKTFIYIIKLLLGDGPRINLASRLDVSRVSDRKLVHGACYDNCFYTFIRDINETLKAAGFTTNADWYREKANIQWASHNSAYDPFDPLDKAFAIENLRKEMRYNIHERWIAKDKIKPSMKDLENAMKDCNERCQTIDQVFDRLKELGAYE